MPQAVVLAPPPPRLAGRFRRPTNCATDKQYCGRFNSSGSSAILAAIRRPSWRVAPPKNLLTLSGPPAGSFRLVFGAEPSFSRYIHIDLRVACTTWHVIDAFPLSIYVAFNDAFVGWRS
jgi:hypothetical protein